MAKRAPTTVRVNWKEGEHFEASAPGERTFVLDGNNKAGPSPTEALLSALAGCMAIDVVMILQKMRVPLESLEVDCTGDRNEEPPRFFTAIRLDFTVSGAVPVDKLRRAIDLSFEKYCSVYHSLNPSTEVSYRTNLD